MLTLLAVVAALVPLAGPAMAHSEADPYVADLIAGGGSPASAIDVGDVQIWNDADYLYAKYLVDAPGWCLTQTHLEVAASVAGIPQTRKGNPIPGRFTYAGMHACVDNVTYTIPLDRPTGTSLYIAAHSVVAELVGYEAPDLSAFASALPEQVTMSVVYPGLGFGDPSLFDVTISGGTALDGMSDGYCVDTDHLISSSTAYVADVYSSYEPLPTGLIEYPENLDLVNWILNEGFVGRPSSCDGVYTYGDVQRAIWALVEDTPLTSGLGPWSQCRVDEILAAAYAYGEGFTPACGDVIGVILEPFFDSAVAQVLIAETTASAVGVECDPIYDYATAWGDGAMFPGKNWATYLSYTVQEPARGSIGDLVWNDTDGDGVQDAGEPGVSGVVVTLYDGASNEIASTTTNGNGFFLFTYLEPGDYRLEVSLPAEAIFSPRAIGGDPTIDSDATPLGVIGPIVIGSGEDQTYWDAGIFWPA